MAISELVFSALSLLILVSASDETTYVRVLSSGLKVVCDRCQPGYYLRAHCTETRRTECRPCTEGYFTQYWNYISECLPCNLCSLNQEETQPCTRFHNRVCQCKEGFYWSSHFCRKHTDCPAGHGIKTKGTPFKDTECEECTNGRYAVGPVGSALCTPFTACKGDERLVIHGNTWHDNVCVTCENITKQGWPTLIKPLLSELFAQQKQKLQKRIRRLLSLNGSRTETALQHIQEWLSTASDQKLTELAGKLRSASLTNLADKVEHKIRRFQEEVTHCTNIII